MMVNSIFSQLDMGWNNSQALEKTQMRDKIKNEWAKNNNIRLVRIPYTQYDDLNLQMILGDIKNETLSD